MPTPRLLTLLSIGLIFAPYARPAEPAAATGPTTRPRLDITLGNVLWQPLPDRVYRVHIGPDNRVWYQLDFTNLPADTAELKQRIEREFGQPSPQIDGASLLLFEPTGGRVWFYRGARFRETLFGYDGKTWIEHPLQRDHSLNPEADNRGPTRASSCCLFAAGVAFFTDQYGVEQFDGKQWSYTTLSDESAPYPYHPFIEPEPDGKGVVAVVEGANPRLWRWRDGQWTRAADPVGLENVVRVAPAPTGGVWTLSSRNEFRFHPYDANDLAALQKIIGQLDSPDAATRDRAAATLAGMGDSVIPVLEKALADARTPARITGIQTALANLRGGAGNRRTATTNAFGNYRVTGVRGLEYLADRSTLLAAEQIIDPQGKSLGPGLLRQPKGAAAPHVTLGQQLARAFDHPRTGPILLPDGTRAWLPRNDVARIPMTLVDLDTGKALATIPDGRYPQVFAVRFDGALFVGTGDGSGGGVRALFTPGAPDDRNLLQADATQISGPITAIAADGRLYAHARDQGLIRYDAKTWTPLHALDHKADRRLDGAIAGAGPRAAVLVHARNAAALVVGDTVTTGGDVRALVTANRATVAAEFPQATRGNYAAASNGLTNLFADAAGNLWLLDAQRLSVLAGDHWLDTDTPLRAAGSPAGYVSYASAVGDGSKVYVTDFATLNRGVAALGEVRNDNGPTVVFTPAHRTGERELTYLTLRDPAGALWLPITYRPGDPGRPSGRWATRLTDKGVDAQFDNAGLPMLVDRGGTVWLGQPLRPGDRIPVRLNLWRDGRVVHSLDITGAGDRFRLFADRPGSVWAWTDLGLQHFIAKDPADPRTYALARTYTPQGVDRRIELVEFSPLGFVALTAATIAPEAPRTLYLVRLPAD